MEKKFTIPEAAVNLFGFKLKNTFEYFLDNISDVNFDGEEPTIERKQKYNLEFFIANISLLQKHSRTKITQEEIQIKLDTYYDGKMKQQEDYKEAKEREKKRLEAQEKNEKLIAELEALRANAMGIGTNKLKRRLNKLAEGNVDAKICRLALEIEDVSTQAKAARGEYKDKKYYKKTLLIDELVELYSQTDYHYGIEWKDGRETNSIIYFDLPNAVQISFHTTWGKETPIKEYGKEWDGLVNATFKKIINFLEENFKDEILKFGK